MYIDLHVHTRFHSMLPYSDGSIRLTPEELRKFYDEAGISKAVVLVQGATPCATGGQAVEEVVELSKSRYPWIIPWANIAPDMVDNSAYTDGMERLVSYYKDLGCKGVGELSSSHYFDDPKMLNLFAACEKYRMPVLFHIAPVYGTRYGVADDSGLPRLELCLKCFHDLIFIGHSQAFWAELGANPTQEERDGYPAGKVTEEGRIPFLMRKYPNLHADLSASSGLNAMMRDPEYAAKFLTEFQDRIYFGSDIVTTKEFDRVRESIRFYDSLCESGAISREVYEKIAHINAEQLMDLV